MYAMLSSKNSHQFRTINEKIVLPDELIDEIGEYLGFHMRNKHTVIRMNGLTGCREDNTIITDFFVKGNIVYFNNKVPLLVFQNQSFNKKSLFTLNLLTLKCTYNSPTQKLLSPELVDKIKKYTNPIIKPLK
jgi:hypothetical protein